MSRRLLVIGRGGQLARSLADRARMAGVPIDFAGRPEVDLLDHGSIRRLVETSGPDIIINTAAYTAVDRAEDEPELAHQVNAVAPGILAAAARSAGASLIHISTDYVFDGSGGTAWKEDDPTGPRSVYGRTKLAGEEAVRDQLAAHAIVRTSWVYSPFGQNFVKTMLALAETRPELRVVGDQIGNPTSALVLADALLAMVSAWRGEPSFGLGATYHVAGSGHTSWAEFAREIFAQSSDLGRPSAAVTAIATSEWPAKAPRPANSRLSSDRFALTFGFVVPRWQDSLREVVARLVRPEPALGESARPV